MNGIPPEVEDWIKSQDRPFTIFFTPKQEIVFVWGDKPWKDFIKPEPEKFTGLLDPRRYNYMSPEEWKNSLLSLGDEEADKPD